MGNIPQAIEDHDVYIVVSLFADKPIESHYTMAKAERAVNILNEHNQQHGHKERFVIKHRSTVSSLRK